jgi:hypothetical protein
MVIPSAQRTVGVGGFGENRASMTASNPPSGRLAVSPSHAAGIACPDADDLLALVVPGVEKELRVLGDHAPEQSLQDGPLVRERRA